MSTQHLGYSVGYYAILPVLQRHSMCSQQPLRGYSRGRMGVCRGLRRLCGVLGGTVGTHACALEVARSLRKERRISPHAFTLSRNDTPAHARMRFRTSSASLCPRRRIYTWVPGDAIVQRRMSCISFCFCVCARVCVRGCMRCAYTLACVPVHASLGVRSCACTFEGVCIQRVCARAPCGCVGTVVA